MTDTTPAATPEGAAHVKPETSPLRLILGRELGDLWLGGRLLFLLVLFAILMSATSIMRELESATSLIPPAEMIYLTLISTISFGILVSLIVGADAVSGERERATLEPVLLAPVTRRQIVLAKYIAAVSPWPVTLLISVPYVLVVAEGHDILGTAFFWAFLTGSLLAISFAGFGILVSIWSRSNRTSLLVSLFAYVILLIPTLLPGEAQKGALGYAIQQLNPMQATSSFLEKLIVNNRTLEEYAGYLVANIITAVLFSGLLLFYAAPRMELEGGGPAFGRPRRRIARSAAAVGTVLLLALGLLAPSAGALGAGVVGPSPSTADLAAIEPASLTIEIDMETAVVKTGDEIVFATTVTNTGQETSPEVMVAMNIINIGQGEPVDPEDWSPERTQEAGALEPGESAEQDWSIEAILDGDYMIYMTAIPIPESPDNTSQPIASPGIHLVVDPFQSTNPGGVLPIAIGMPLLLIVLTVLLRRYWRRDRSAGDEASS